MEKICIIGSLNMELILGPVDKIPDWGKQTFVEKFDLRRAGAAVSVAFPLAKLGIKSSIIGSVGKDHNGQEIINNIRDFGLTTEGVDIVKGTGTGVCISIRKETGDRLYISHLGALTQFNEINIVNHDALIQEAKYLLLTGYFVLPGLRGDGILNIFKRAKREGKIILLDTGWAPDDWSEETVKEILSLLEYVDVFLPNLDEAEALTKGKSPDEMANKLSSCGPDTVIIKIGEKGSLAKTHGRVFTQDAFLTNVVDTTAAGEAFNAGVLYGLVNKWKMQETLKFSNALASLVISKVSSEYPTLDEVRRAMKSKAKEGDGSNETMGIQNI